MGASIFSSRFVRCSFLVFVVFASKGAIAAYETNVSQGVQWLADSQNEDGSWGTLEVEKWLYTLEAVQALKAAGFRDVAYYRGLTWLENHNNNNLDFAARRAARLYEHGADVEGELQKLISAQSPAEFGRRGWGVSEYYLSSPLDTAVVVSATQELQQSLDTDAAVNYLLDSQLTRAGWSSSQSDEPDLMTSAMVVKALGPFQYSDPSLSLPVSNAIDELNTLASNETPVYLQALVAQALLSSEAYGDAQYWLTLLSNAQSSNGSWNGQVYDTAATVTALAQADGSLDPEAQELVSISDANLRAAINAALGRNKMSNISRVELAQLTSLTAIDAGITNLDGLQWAVNLQFLDLRGNGITSTAPLDDLTALTALDLSGNPIDSDNDGLFDDLEIAMGINPFSADTDGDLLNDFEEVCFDGDCSQYNPFPRGRDTDASLADTDRDGMSDYTELTSSRSPVLNEPVLVVIITRTLR